MSIAKITLCKNCKYWIDNTKENGSHYQDKDIIHPLDENTFKNKKMPFEVRKCKNPNQTLFERNPNINGISLSDGSNYYAALYTGEEFGCVGGENNERKTY